MLNLFGSPIVWYIPGFFSADDPQTKALQLIKNIYPNAEDIQNVVWENQNGKNIILQSIEMMNRDLTAVPAMMVLNVAARWLKALSDVERWSELLAEKIAKDLSMRQRRNLILIGHSLGGNIAIRTLSRLHRQNLSIHSAVLLGAAIGCKDENIPLAMKATLKPVCSMVNPNDAALKVFQTVTGSPALGTGCKLACDHSEFREFPTSPSINHSSVFYLTQWAEVNNNKKDNSPIQTLVDIANVFFKK